ncbi:hypothetical protein L1987_19370 [Smallanthus sonchifolius]|uniref:Uncharacterized protein n=1 Tax=Smallanthus sonchifolius TaxID=185202 RepID=A0ACB9IQL1_9ASTR|nr:hypothetical protein L1987_19370 [Smallanthus sonchifolius]
MPLWTSNFRSLEQKGQDFLQHMHVLYMRSRKPTSSVEADIAGGGSITCSNDHPKPEAYIASSKRYAFKEGDRVKYVGSLHSGFSPLGPVYGYKRKVLLAFDENGSSKIGVRFDETNYRRPWLFLSRFLRRRQQIDVVPTESIAKSLLCSHFCSEDNNHKSHSKDVISP